VQDGRRWGLATAVIGNDFQCYSMLGSISTMHFTRPVMSGGCAGRSSAGLPARAFDRKRIIAGGCYSQYLPHGLLIHLVSCPGPGDGLLVAGIVGFSSARALIDGSASIRLHGSQLEGRRGADAVRGVGVGWVMCGCLDILCPL